MCLDDRFCCAERIAQAHSDSTIYFWHSWIREMIFVMESVWLL